YFESWVYFFVCLYFFLKKLHRPSDYLINYILFSFLSPLFVYYGLTNSDRYHLLMVLFCATLVLYFRNGKIIKFPVLKNGRKIALAILFLGALLTTVWMIFIGGLRFFNLDLTRVYEYREDSGAL